MILEYVEKTNHVRNECLNDFMQEFNLTGSETFEEINSTGMLKPEIEAYLEVLSLNCPFPKIDIYSLLGMKRTNGDPLWAFVNPNHNISGFNGAFVDDRNLEMYYKEKKDTRSARSPKTFLVAGERGHYKGISLDHKLFGETYNLEDYLKGSKYKMPSGGFPLVPKNVRKLISSYILKTADVVGVLYMPTSWDEIVLPEKKDPALVFAKNNQFYCAAVWGHDGPNIMEFTY